MGHCFGIGEAQIQWSPESVRIWIKEERHDNAPANDVPTDHTNYRWPSYVGWHGFLERTKLEALFGSEKIEIKINTDVMGLLPNHSGAAPITKHHLVILRRKSKAYRKAHVNDTSKEVGYDIAKLDWLEYWMAWAIKNCTNPVFVNS